MSFKIITMNEGVKVGGLIYAIRKLAKEADSETRLR
jgi:hypothetical protein